MSTNKLAVVLSALIAWPSGAFAQAVWTSPASAAAADLSATGPQVDVAALVEDVRLMNATPNTFGMGAAVAIDGDTVAIGAPRIASAGLQRGAVSIFTRGSGGWQLQQVLQPSVGTGFGWSVDLSGDTLIVTREGNAQVEALVYVRSGGTWAFQASLQPQNGTAGTVAIDGNTALVGSFGAADVYVRSGTAWTHQTRLVAPDRGSGSPSWRFGQSGPRSIALEGDTAVIGATHAPVGGNVEQGAVYVFTRSGTNWSPQAKLLHGAGSQISRLGRDVALSGDTILASGGGLGAYVFERSGSTWTERPALQIPLSPPSCAVCPAIPTVVGSVAIHGNAAAVAGRPGEGGTDPPAVYAFKRIGTSWFLQEQLVPSDRQTLSAVALDGNTVLAGSEAFGYNSFAGAWGPGAAYLFTLSDVLPNSPPAPPTLTASVTGTTAHLSWTAAAGPAAQSYFVEAGTAPGLSNVFNGNVGAVTQLSADAPPGTYYVRVRGANAFGTGGASLEHQITIGALAPPVVTSAVESGGILSVAWQPAPGSFATAHRLDFYSGNALVASVPAGPGTNVAIAIPPGTQGTFGVRVVDLERAGAPPSELFVFTISGTCTPPSSPVVSGGVAAGTASVTWAAVTGATAYVLSAGTTPGGTDYMPPTDLGANTGASASGLSPGFSAWVRVVAVNACGQQSAPADFLVQ